MKFIAALIVLASAQEEAHTETRFLQEEAPAPVEAFEAAVTNAEVEFEEEAEADGKNAMYYIWAGLSAVQTARACYSNARKFFGI